MITWTEKKVKITDITPSDYNPRTISDHDFKALKRSLEKFGQSHPIICNKNMAIVGGHMTAKAAKELGWEFINISIPDKQIPKNKEKALNLALNRIHGDWDYDRLEGILAGLNSEDIELTGFDEDEIEDIMNYEEIPLKYAGLNDDKHIYSTNSFGITLGKFNYFIKRNDEVNAFDEDLSQVSEESSYSEINKELAARIFRVLCDHKDEIILCEQREK